MNAEPDSPRRPITDSPWYWLNLFATFGLVALILMDPKFSARQAQMERNYQARQRAMQSRIGQAPSTPLSTEENTTIRLWPLIVVMTVLLLAGWAGLCFHHYRGPQPAAASAPSTTRLTAAEHGRNAH
jgi:hypothetical protein